MMLIAFVIVGFMLLLTPIIYMGWDLISDLIEWKAYGAIAMLASIVAGVIILSLCSYCLK